MLKCFLENARKEVCNFMESWPSISFHLLFVEVATFIHCMVYVSIALATTGLMARHGMFR